MLFYISNEIVYFFKICFFNYVLIQNLKKAINLIYASYYCHLQALRWFYFTEITPNFLRLSESLYIRYLHERIQLKFLIFKQQEVLEEYTDFCECGLYLYLDNPF